MPKAEINIKGVIVNIFCNGVVHVSAVEASGNFFVVASHTTQNKYSIPENRYLVWYCRDHVSSCNIYAVQQDTQSFLMIIH